MLRVLYPLAPHITTSLWDELGYVKELGEIIDSPWPKVDPEALAADEIQLVVQVNGKLRGRIMVAPDASREEIEKTALADADVSRFLGDTWRRSSACMSFRSEAAREYRRSGSEGLI